MEENNYDKAIEVISEGIINCPKTSFLHYNRACFYVHQQQSELAVNDLITAVDLSRELEAYMKEDRELDPIREMEQYRNRFECLL